MATIGQSLTTPEAGWRRIDDTDLKIIYTGKWLSGDAASGYWQSKKNNGYGSDSSVHFMFYGTKIRLIGLRGNDRTDSADVYIDGVKVGNIVQYISGSTIIYRSLDFEVAGLENKAHDVIVKNNNSDTTVICYTLDAIDIDAAGYLIAIISVNLIATGGNKQVTIKWDAVTDATSYNVKRATTAGGPYETIANNISGNSYVDTNVENGTTYYYVVSAVTAGEESDNSNEASATPEADDGQAILRVTMIDSSEREYKLPLSEINEFISWLDSHSSGDTLSYRLNTAFGNKEHLLFDKIISFEVIPVA